MTWIEMSDGVTPTSVALSGTDLHWAEPHLDAVVVVPDELLDDTTIMLSATTTTTNQRYLFN